MRSIRLVLLACATLPLFATTSAAAEPAWSGGLSYAPVGFSYYGGGIAGLSDAKFEHTVFLPNTTSFFLVLQLARHFAVRLGTDLAVPLPPDPNGWIFHGRVVGSPTLQIPLSQRVRFSVGPEIGLSAMAYRSRREEVYLHFDPLWNGSRWGFEADRYFRFGRAFSARAEVTIAPREADGWALNLGYLAWVDRSGFGCCGGYLATISLGELSVGLRRPF